MDDNITASAEAFGGMQWELLGIPLFYGDKPEALKLIDDKISGGTKRYRIATVNPEFIMLALRDEKFNSLLKNSSC